MTMESRAMDIGNQVPDPSRSAAKAITSTAHALDTVANTQSSVLGLFNSWAQFGAVGMMAAITAALVAGQLWSASADRAQHSKDVQSVLQSMQGQHQQNIMNQNRQVDMLSKGIEASGVMTSKSLDNMAAELRGFVQRAEKK